MITHPMSSPFAAPPEPDAEDQRLADLEIFVRGVVHDLNNALNVMKTNLYLLRQRLPGEEIKVQRPLERIDDQVEVIRSLLSGHQSLYHAGHPMRQRTDLNDVVRAAVEDARIPDGYRLELRLDRSLPQVDLDPKLTSLALRAVLRNAVRAMPGSGDIRVSTCQRGLYAEISVEDSGPGFPPEIEHEAFRPFVSTWPEHAGLGLALTDRVARGHGGHALVESEEGQGARVAICLPL
jgi:signal transduction histidine kinase